MHVYVGYPRNKKPAYQEENIWLGPNGVWGGSSGITGLGSGFL